MLFCGSFRTTLTKKVIIMVDLLKSRIVEISFILKITMGLRLFKIEVKSKSKSTKTKCDEIVNKKNGTNIWKISLYSNSWQCLEKNELYIVPIWGQECLDAKLSWEYHDFLARQSLCSHPVLRFAASFYDWKSP